MTTCSLNFIASLYCSSYAIFSTIYMNPLKKRTLTVASSLLFLITFQGHQWSGNPNLNRHGDEPPSFQKAVCVCVIQSTQLSQPEEIPPIPCVDSPSKEAIDCNVLNCSADCVWGTWSDWSSCGTSCGGGLLETSVQGIVATEGKVGGKRHCWIVYTL